MVQTEVISRSLTVYLQRPLFQIRSHSQVSMLTSPGAGGEGGGRSPSCYLPGAGCTLVGNKCLLLKELQKHITPPFLETCFSSSTSYLLTRFNWLHFHINPSGEFSLVTVEKTGLVQQLGMECCKSGIFMEDPGETSRRVGHTDLVVTTCTEVCFNFY